MTDFFIDLLVTNHIYLIYMYKPGLALNNPQWLIYHKTKSNHPLVLLVSSRNFEYGIVFFFLFWSRLESVPHKILIR